MESYSNLNNIKYDWILQVRLDTVLINLFNLKDLNNTNFF